MALIDMDPRMYMPCHICRAEPFTKHSSICSAAGWQEARVVARHLEDALIASRVAEGEAMTILEGTELRLQKAETEVAVQEMLVTTFTGLYQAEQQKIKNLRAYWTGKLQRWQSEPGHGEACMLVRQFLETIDGS